MTTVHARNQIFILNFPELHFLKTVVQNGYKIVQQIT